MTKPSRIFKKILIAVDHGEPSTRASRVGYSLALEMGAHVLLVHVVNHPPAGRAMVSASRVLLLASLRRKGRSLLRRIHTRGGQTVTIDEMLREGIPAEEILATATEWKAQLIVIGAHGQSRLGNLLLGTTAETVARRARCPVVTVGDESEALETVHELAG